MRDEYPHLVQVFKNSYLSPEIIKGLSMALDDLGDTPIIVRSSSLLEDSMSASFSGKYKSLFLANTGTKSERLAALMHAITEVYASIFGPDPIEYRAERGLLDFHEEMGIMIQEVVGTRVGKYFFSAFAGVAFSNNEFPLVAAHQARGRVSSAWCPASARARWTGSATTSHPHRARAAQFARQRVSGRDGRVLAQAHRRHQSRDADLQTIEVADLLREHGQDYPLVHRIVSIFEHDHMRPPVGINIDFERAEMAVTFDGLVTTTPFVKQIHAILRLLQEKLETPVDIEFAATASTCPAAVPPAELLRATARRRDSARHLEPPENLSPPTGTSPTAPCPTSPTWCT
ncbi:MAG: hypothetical protein IPP94_18630 [Ignavibacteria bacterium]|nr:hypothetical protein [Ignavibacteria bacterium]